MRRPSRPRTPGGVKLSAAAWRTLYNVLDALQPEEEPGADPAPAVEAWLTTPKQARALRGTLRWLALESRLLRAPGRGFCWLPRAERRALLARWSRSVLPWRRRGFERLAAAAEAARRAQSRPGS
jgi:hypothetical protein